MKATTRSTKEDRRREIVEAAIGEFADGGLHGTAVGAIARQVGVSQPYLFQLFGTKKDLFIAAVRRTFERTVGAFRAAAAEAGEDAPTEAVLMVMGLAYQRLLADRKLLLMQMQAYSVVRRRGDPRGRARGDAAPGQRPVGLGRGGEGRARVGWPTGC